ncbi:MAG TPA: hypothetical protein HA257_01200 [Candidatus Methanoperedenaceae archaeon]|nr:hypothetical protein [Candidatus Methanoperedenaceae archaeon]
MRNKDQEITKNKIDEEILEETKRQTLIMSIELCILIFSIFGVVIAWSQFSHQINNEEPDLRFGDAQYGIYGTSIVIPLENIATASFDASITNIKVLIRDKDTNRQISANRYVFPENITKSSNINDGNYSSKLSFFPFYSLVDKEPVYIEVIYSPSNELLTPQYWTNKLVADEPLNPIGDYELNIEIDYREIGDDTVHVIKVPITFGFKNGKITAPVTGKTEKIK